MSKVTPFAYKVKSMKKIIDGDTFDCILDLGFDVLLEARVRMAGIDTPESRTRDLIEKQFGLASKEYLGTVYLDGVNVNEKMIEDGYAVGYHGQSKDDIESNHLVNRDRLLTENKVQLDPDFGK